MWCVVQQLRAFACIDSNLRKTIVFDAARIQQYAGTRDCFRLASISKWCAAAEQRSQSLPHTAGVHRRHSVRALPVLKPTANYVLVCNDDI